MKQDDYDTNSDAAMARMGFANANATNGATTHGATTHGVAPTNANANVNVNHDSTHYGVAHGQRKQPSPIAESSTYAPSDPINSRDIQIATNGPQGNAPPQGNAHPQGNAPPQGNAHPQGNAPLQGNAPPQGNARPQGNAHPQGNAPPQGNSPQGTRNGAYTQSPNNASYAPNPGTKVKPWVMDKFGLTDFDKIAKAMPAAQQQGGKQQGGGGASGTSVARPVPVLMRALKRRLNGSTRHGR